MSRFPLVSSSLTSCDGNRCSRLRKVYGSAVLCLAVLERSSRKRAPSAPLPHQAAPAAPQQAGPRAPPWDASTAQKTQGLRGGCQPSPFSRSLDIQSDAIKRQRLEPGRSDNFIRAKRTPFLCLLRNPRSLLEAILRRAEAVVRNQKASR